MKIYELLLRKVASWLRSSSPSENPDDSGPLLFVHITPYHFEENDGWMAQTFFAGNVPSPSCLVAVSDTVSYQVVPCHATISWLVYIYIFMFFGVNPRICQTYFQCDLTLIQSWYLSGQHYSRTLEDWLRRTRQEDVQSVSMNPVRRCSLND
jgi:cyclopropane fatty-acyl-phospholipid synthase-like methyltransferase